MTISEINYFIIVKVMEIETLNAGMILCLQALKRQPTDLSQRDEKRWSTSYYSLERIHTYYKQGRSKLIFCYGRNRNLRPSRNNFQITLKNYHGNCTCKKVYKQTTYVITLASYDCLIWFFS
jgi:hypothetical protein